VIGVSFQYLGLLEQGKRCPSVAVAKDIVRALGLQGSPDAHEVQLAARLLAVARSDAGRSFPRSL
jgi:DNA-binding XRE family transcriptional regulator